LQYPLEFHLGTYHIHAHLLFEMLAYALGYRLYVRQRARSRDPINDEQRWLIFIGAAAGAFLGSRLLGVLERPADLAQLNWLIWLDNKTVVGGFLGGLIGVETTKKAIGVRVSSGDLMAYPIIFALVIGRLGCHFAGLGDGTHGLPSTLPWAIDFGDGIPRHPVNLYEIAMLCGIAAAIWYREKQSPLSDGMRFKIFMICYLFWRFFVEWLKPVWLFPFGLSTIQLACLAGLFYYRKTLALMIRNVFP
jgi:prolipoprotein diacylglyceryltransferase